MLFNSPSFHDCVFILKRFYPCFHFLISLVLHEVLQIMCGIFGCINWVYFHSFTVSITASQFHIFTGSQF